MQLIVYVQKGHKFWLDNFLDLLSGGSHLFLKFWRIKLGYLSTHFDESSLIAELLINTQQISVTFVNKLLGCMYKV